MRRWLAIGGVVLLAGLFVARCTPLVKYAHPAPWELATLPKQTTTSIDIVVLGGGCYADHESLSDIDVEESADAVAITASIRKPAVYQSVCNDVLRLHPTTVELPAPLGERRLIDGSTGQEPPRAAHLR